MAVADPTKPQVTNPDRVADVIRLLQVRGPLGVLDVADVVIPVINLGDAVARTVTVLTPAFRSTDVFSSGEQVTAPAGTIFAGTGALAAGIYDVIVTLDTFDMNVGQMVKLQHRDAADAANLMEIDLFQSQAAAFTIGRHLPFAYEIGESERLRLITNANMNAGSRIVGVIFARRRT